VVSSYAIDDGDRLLLFDPLAPPGEVDELAAGRPRDGDSAVLPVASARPLGLADRLEAQIYVPPPDPALGQGLAARGDPRVAAFAATS